ncbi:hypothetical protein TRFO_16772 [Tritrichomonas foetus]|uniref:Uncharacterized protein n=1 Tax=Tritrichomonas foetus TaxID=1144522 RepID=A0A1J4KUN1_9EUKA|nr:hypothetical protein TRFO_16772 [Tritrichomonas foetus]|eukprot:OHT13205.1 hypothetical protein TRFO_16772 [Tritrichomonas foetus]
MVIEQHPHSILASNLLHTPAIILMEVHQTKMKITTSAEIIIFLTMLLMQICLPTPLIIIIIKIIIITIMTTILDQQLSRDHLERGSINQALFLNSERIRLEQVDPLEQQMVHLEQQVDHLEQQVDHLEQQEVHLEQQVDHLEQQVDPLEILVDIFHRGFFNQTIMEVVNPQTSKYQ